MKRRPGSSRKPLIREAEPGGFLPGRSLGVGCLLIAFLCSLLVNFYPPRSPWASNGQAGPSGVRGMIVPPQGAITDFEARWALARVLSYNRDTLDESMGQYRILCEQRPEKALLRLEMAGVLLKKGARREALSVLKELALKSPDDPEILLTLADVEAGLGHARKCRDLYVGFLKGHRKEEDVLLRFADQMNSWGDFYKTEAIYRRYLKDHPGDTGMWMKLASLLGSCERYEESEGIYRKLLFESQDNHQALLGLAKVKQKEKAFEAAKQYVDRFLRIRPDDPEGLLLKAEIAFLDKQYDRALEIYTKLAGVSSPSGQALVGMGKVRLEQGDLEEAKGCFRRALALDAQNVEARFYEAGPERRHSENFVAALLEAPDTSAAGLEDWARQYVSQGDYPIAVRFYEASLQRDPQYFPSQIGLAEALAIDHQYDRAVDHFKDLAGVFPGNRKILIGWARTLGWAKRYQESMGLYDQIHAFAPADPVPQKEKARTAVWAKRMNLALRTYDQLLEPPVDESLATALPPIIRGSENDVLGQKASKLSKRAEKGSLYEGYEAFSEDFEAVKTALPPAAKRRIEGELIRLLPVYALQKGVFLEKRAKHLAWNTRFTRALKGYKELTRFAPGNQEALWDYAQVQCALGLCDREATTYRKLLDVDKQHRLARRALKRVEIRRNPSIEPEYSFWSERGRDGLTDIDRHRFDLTLDVPVYCRFHLRLTGHHWGERPSYTKESYGADGFTLALNAVLNPYVKGEAGWTKKVYRDDGFDNQDTGYVHVSANFWDYAQVGAGYDQTNELYNYFGIEQGIQADAWWMSIAVPVTRKLEVQGKARYLSYNDDNSGQHYLLEAGYALTDHPRLFKVAAFTEHRDTRKQDIYRYTGGRLVDITHPYWTPDDYYGGGLRFEWHHDLSRFFFCGSEKNDYSLKLALGADTEHNPSLQLTGDWHYDFLDHWTFKIEGLIHRSELWDAEGVWIKLRYRF